MEPEEIGRSYDKIAEVWLGTHIQTDGMAHLERAIRFTENRGAALDIGCGCSGRFIDCLTKHGFQAEGIDVSERMVALARERNPGTTFYRGDVSQWEFPRKYEFISAWDSTWHLPLDRQEPVLRKICKHLTPGGVFIFTTGGLDEATEKRDSNMGPPVYYSVLGIPRVLELLAQCGCVCRHLEYDQYPEKHVYVIAQKWSG